MQKKLLLIQEDLVRIAEVQRDIIQKEFELGLTLETDYLEYVISFTKIVNEREKYERELQKLERKFKIQLGFDENAIFEIDDNFSERNSFYLLKPYREAIWSIVKGSSLDLKKKEINLLYEKKQMAYNKRVLLPSVSLQSSMSFSGDSYPLTEPVFSVKCNISFNNKLFPVSFSNGYGFNQTQLYNVNNSAEIGILNSTTSFTENRIQDITMMLKELDLRNTETTLYESIYDTVDTHDDYVKEIELKLQMIRLLEARLSYSKLNLEKGELKHIDFLNELIALSKEKISLLTIQTEIEKLERSVEIITRIPFGEIDVSIEKNE